MIVKDKMVCVYPPVDADPEATAKYLEESSLIKTGDDIGSIVGKFICGIGPLAFFPHVEHDHMGQEHCSPVSKTSRDLAEKFFDTCSQSVGIELIDSFLQRFTDDSLSRKKILTTIENTVSEKTVHND